MSKNKVENMVDEERKQRDDDLFDKMAQAKAKWDAEAHDDEDGPDETDALLSQAIALALEQGRGWKAGEKEEYLKRITDDDNLPPLFASTPEELEKSGMAEAFSSLLYDDPPERLMNECKKKGTDAFLNGKRNVAKNVQYYRTAIDHYYEAFAWAQRVKPVEEGYTPELDDHGNTENDQIFYTQRELDEFKSIVQANAAMAHMELKNWGLVRDDCTKALEYNKNNIKAWYRLGKAHQMLHNWEEAGDAIDSGLKVESGNKELRKLQDVLESKVCRARLERQKKERARAERVSRIKEVWKYCKERGIQLGRVPLVASVTDEEEDDDETEEARWHHHHPHTGRVPQRSATHDGEWTWPCMFVYPSHHNSDFIEHFAESDLIAYHMAEIFPEMDEGEETLMPWDYNNEFRCSNLAVYFEVHRCCTEKKSGMIVHPECVEPLNDLGATMRFYESCRALKGDEGPEMTNIAQLLERKHLHAQRKAWKKKHGSLWAKPDPCPLVQVHPATSLVKVLTDCRMIVPNFLVTFLLFPINHPAHVAFLKEHKCIDIIQPESVQS